MLHTRARSRAWRMHYMTGQQQQLHQQPQGFAKLERTLPWPLRRGFSLRSTSGHRSA